MGLWNRPAHNGNSRGSLFRFFRDSGAHFFGSFGALLRGSLSRHDLIFPGFPGPILCGAGPIANLFTRKHMVLAQRKLTAKQLHQMTVNLLWGKGKKTHDLSTDSAGPPGPKSPNHLKNGLLCRV